MITDYIRGVAVNVNIDYTCGMKKTLPRDAHHHGNLKEALILYTLSAADCGALADLSLRDAARELGVSPGAAYRHFPDKEALLRAVAQRGFDALAEAFEAVLPFASGARDAGEARTRFLALATTYVGFAHRRKDLWRLMFGPLGGGARPTVNRPSTYDWLGKCLGELEGFGLIAPFRPEHQFFAWSSIHGLSDLQASPAIAGRPTQNMIKCQCSLIIAALAELSES